MQDKRCTNSSTAIESVRRSMSLQACTLQSTSRAGQKRATSSRSRRGRTPRRCTGCYARSPLPASFTRARDRGFRSRRWVSTFAAMSPALAMPGQHSAVALPIGPHGAIYAIVSAAGKTPSNTLKGLTFGNIGHRTLLRVTFSISRCEKAPFGLSTMLRRVAISADSIALPISAEEMDLFSPLF